MGFLRGLRIEGRGWEKRLSRRPPLNEPVRKGRRGDSEGGWVEKGGTD